MNEIYGFKATINTQPVATTPASNQVDIDQITATATQAAAETATSVATSTVQAALAAAGSTSSSQGAGWLALSKNALVPAGTRPGTMIVRTV